MQYKALVDGKILDFTEEMVDYDGVTNVSDYAYDTCELFMMTKEKFELLKAEAEYNFILCNDRVITRFMSEDRDDELPTEYLEFNTENATAEGYEKVNEALKKFSEENK